jgi:hypothetical protein
VSIDFVRTTPFSQQVDIPSQIRTVDELRKYFKTLRNHPRILIEEDKIKKRRTLEDYLEGAKPRSQLAQFQSNYEEFVGKVRRDIQTLKRWTLVERFVLFVAVAGLFTATLNYFRGFVADINAATKEVKALVATSNINGYHSRISSLETNSVPILDHVRDQVASLASSSSAMGSNVTKLEDRLMNLESQVAQYRRGLTNSGPAKSKTERDK